ncbi:MAG: hypothetical protein F6K42_12780 [Leptolyngbya sp. SIO1D8]|nr:hypothetical protein [Leptolyngbya sp. SIO1D8]
MAIPRVVPASKLNTFKFYESHAIYEGIFYAGTILKLAKTFPLSKREKVYQFACKLSREYMTLISPSSTSYRVWVDIRHPIDVHPSLHLNKTRDNPLALREE